METQTCKVCEEEKDITKYEWAADRPNPRTTCNACRSKNREFTPTQLKRKKEYQKEWFKENKTRLKFYYAERTYGLLPEHYKEMLASQNNSCAICNISFTERKEHVDHDHTTGAVRALLCGNCNTGLGMFGEDIAALQNAVKYLENFVDMPHFQIEDDS